MTNANTIAATLATRTEALANVARVHPYSARELAAWANLATDYVATNGARTTVASLLRWLEGSCFSAQQAAAAVMAARECGFIRINDAGRVRLA